LRILLGRRALSVRDVRESERYGACGAKDGSCLHDLTPSKRQQGLEPVAAPVQIKPGAAASGARQALLAIPARPERAVAWLRAWPAAWSMENGTRQTPRMAFEVADAPEESSEGR
jgi:hypothetical protein